MQSPLKLLKKVVLVMAIALFCSSCSNAYLPPVESNPWQVIQVDTESSFSDIDFTDDLSHGWLVGTGSGLFETTDGGQSWQERSLNLESSKYRFTSVSFSGQEGWVVGQPSILLHTANGGQSWEQIPLSDKLPGSPNTIAALSQNSAEMTTDIGAIYRTTDGGRTWKAMVEEAVGVLRNISRSPDGKYVAVSARGNFYSVWEPGLSAWEPHNRNSSRRLQNMGFDQDGKLWLLARGGIVQFGATPQDEAWEDPINPEFSTSWGLLDLAYRTPDELWVTGGSANLLVSPDRGQTWLKDRAVENVPSNFYKVVFLSPDQGFVLGQNGILLKYLPDVQAT